MKIPFADSLRFIAVVTLSSLLPFTHQITAAEAPSTTKNSSLLSSTPLKSTSALPQEKIVQGLKEAISLGIKEAVAQLGKSDGFLKDTQVKIPLPDTFKKAESTLRLLGQGRLMDDLITTMNRAAEQAVPEVATVLGDSVKQMTLTDAQQLLSGPSNAATEYFRKTSDATLLARLLPIIQTATQKCQVTQTYKQVLDKVGAGMVKPELLNQKGLDIDQYVARKALDGLYIKIAEQEKRIRENPAARTTDLLKKVFGSPSKL